MTVSRIVHTRTSYDSSEKSHNRRTLTPTSSNIIIILSIVWTLSNARSYITGLDELNAPYYDGLPNVSCNLGQLCDYRPDITMTDIPFSDAATPCDGSRSFLEENDNSDEICYGMVSK